ncbi:hypothetical protein JZ751_008490, partial [Albula glossodonta]
MKYNTSWILLFCVFTFLTCRVGGNGVLKDDMSGKPPKSENSAVDDLHSRIKYNMRKSLDLDEDGCYLQPGKPECLRECGFNATAKTIFIIHGWTMSGMFESWMHKLVSAVQQRETEANVVVVDWLTLAHQLYPDAVNNTKMVGQSIAVLLDWLQDELQLPLESVHMIGYSLGAHV